ncbi:MAG: hypothetical protein HYY13_13410 [Nitrospirae bacterium]|nr:hypothetical protein [Nitrospirota bacterium]
MHRFGLILLLLGVAVRPAWGVVFLDEDRAIVFTLRAYTQGRLLTQEPERYRKGFSFFDADSQTQGFQETFAVGAPSLLQHRNYVEPQLNMDLSRRQNVTPLLQTLDEKFTLDNVKFFMGARVEYDAVYRYGPDLYTDRIPEAARDDLRSKARLFEIYGDARLFRRVTTRVGQQNISWGEADVFRILDNINPLDNTFGGFLTPLDERRVPSFMIKSTVDLGSTGPIYNAALEGFIEPKPALVPGPTVPAEGPWSVVTGPPSPLSLRLPKKDRWDDARGGGRLLFNCMDTSMSVAQYWTYTESPTPRLAFDTATPAQIKKGVPATATIVDAEYPKGTPYLELAYPRIMVTGGTLSRPVPFSPYTILRMEGAYLFDHPYFLPEESLPLVAPTFELDETKRKNPSSIVDVLARQKAIIQTGQEGGLPKSDLVKWAVGLDHNAWLRFLNPRQTFFVSAQLIGEHWRDLEPGAAYSVQADSYVARVLPPGQSQAQFMTQPDFIPLKTNAYRSTLLVQTGYPLGHGYIQPAFATIAELGEFDALSYLLQPSLQYLLEPFRVRLEYNHIAGAYAGGVGFLKDRDNLMLKLEYVL